MDKILEKKPVKPVKDPITHTIEPRKRNRTRPLYYLGMLFLACLPFLDVRCDSSHVYFSGLQMAVGGGLVVSESSIMYSLGNSYGVEYNKTEGFNVRSAVNNRVKSNQSNKMTTLAIRVFMILLVVAVVLAFLSVKPISLFGTGWSIRLEAILILAALVCLSFQWYYITFDIMPDDSTSNPLFSSAKISMGFTWFFYLSYVLGLFCIWKGLGRSRENVASAATT